MTGQAIVRRALLLVAADAKTHRVVDDPLSHSHLREVAMAHRTFDSRPNVRRVIEPHVGFFKKSEYTLPGHVLASFGVVPERLDPWISGISNVLVTGHADIDAGNACTWAR